MEFSLVLVSLDMIDCYDLILECKSVQEAVSIATGHELYGQDFILCKSKIFLFIAAPRTVLEPSQRPLQLIHGTI
jgi:hypothetical protein